MVYRFIQLTIALVMWQHGQMALGQKAYPQQQTALDQAEDLYASGKFEDAIDLASTSIDDKTKLNDTDKARLYLLRARLDLVFKRNDSARDWLEKLFRLQPNTKLDPIKDTPEAITIWSEIKEENARTNTEPVPAPKPVAAAPSKDTTQPPKPPFRFTGKWLRYGLFAVPVGVAAFSKHDDARYAAMGFLAGAVAITLWQKTFAPTPSSPQTIQVTGFSLPRGSSGVALTWIP